MVPVPLSVDSISLFFRYALSLTAWKRLQETTWSLRANPSSGNLHPTEGYALLPSLDAIHNRPGVYHYASKAHGLERRADLDPLAWAALTAAFPEGSFLVGLSSIHWREAWKYGERAFRYCQHDVGHALGTMRFAAAALGWKLRLLDRVGDAAVSHLLGLDREAGYAGAEREHPELVALVVREKWASDRGLCLSKELVSQVAASRWYGRANVLSPEHGVDWPVIDQVAVATTNPRIAADEEFSRFPSEEELFGAPVRSGAFTAEKVILGRRSAVSMDASTAIPAATFSCGPDIAGDGAFSLGMIAEYMDSLVAYGASFYRNLFWEAGLVGQVLYLEAEEAGIRSTGIGCYFDDPVHEVFGISSRDWQSFYHFTVGGPVEDRRLTILPAYNLEEAR